MVKPTNTREYMFKFSSKLFVWKNRVKKNGFSSLYLHVYISYSGSAERDFFKLNLEWPTEKIDFDNAMLLPRYKEDPDVNDSNMIIMTERAKFNEIAKVYRLANRSLSIKELKREMIFADSNKSVAIFSCVKLSAESVSSLSHFSSDRLTTTCFMGFSAIKQKCCKHSGRERT